MKRAYLPRYGSKRYKEQKRICPKNWHYCIECGRILLHPQSIMNHIGGVCQAKAAKLADAITDKRDLNSQ